MRPIQHILCPVGFTEKSDEAIARAGQMAQLYKADLTLLHVVSSLSAHLGNIYGFDRSDNPEWYLPMTTQAQERARDLLREYKQKHVPYAVKCKSSVRYGQVAQEIIAESKELPADLIVLGTSGQYNLPMGNTVQDIVSRAECPVFTFHQVPESRIFKKILVPVDLSFGVAELTSYLLHYFSLNYPEIEFLTVIDPKDDTEAYRSRIADYLKLFIKQAKQGGLDTAKFNIITSKQVGVAINDYAVAHDFQLLMMNTHGKSGLGNWLLGGITHHILNHSRIPVFTYRAKELHEMERANAS